MRVIAAYLLAVLGGNEKPDAAAVSAILASVGVKAEQEKLDLFFKEIEGKDVGTLIEEGKAKLAKFGGGGGGAAAPAAAAAAAPAAKKEEPKKSSSSSSAGGGMNLFGDD